MKIGIIGNFSDKEKKINGQTIKTQITREYLVKKIGLENVRSVDTNNWKDNIICLCKKIYLLIKTVDVIIIMPNQNGLKIIPLMLEILKIFNKGIKLYYIVIGGWLYDYLLMHPIIKRMIANYKMVFVESKQLKEQLEKLGLKNVEQLVNYKKIVYCGSNEYNDSHVKLCTLSRVIKEKGILDAINSVIDANQYLKKEKYYLDIFGPISEDFKEEFETILINCPKYIKYKGYINYDDTGEVLKKYDILLFPTYYEGEGYAGTLIDAMSAGLLVIATDWKYNGEIIKDKENGILYNRDTTNLKDIILSVNKEMLIKYREKAITDSKKYDADLAIDYLIEMILK